MAYGPKNTIFLFPSGLSQIVRVYIKLFLKNA